MTQSKSIAHLKDIKPGDDVWVKARVFMVANNDMLALLFPLDERAPNEESEPTAVHAIHCYPGDGCYLVPKQTVDEMQNAIARLKNRLHLAGLSTETTP